MSYNISYIYKNYGYKIYFFTHNEERNSVLRIKLDQAVEEVTILIGELEQNINYFDRSIELSTRIQTLTSFKKLNFEKVKKIEIFILYILSQKCNLFKEVKNFSGMTQWVSTPLAKVFKNYDFLYYRDFETPDIYLDFKSSCSNRLNVFIEVLAKQTQMHKMDDDLPSWLHDNYQITPKEVYKKLEDDSVKIPTKDTELKNISKRNINYFVDRLRIVLSGENEKKYKVLVKKTNDKFREYNNYIDELFRIDSNLTFIAFELSLDLFVNTICIRENEYNLLQLKTKFLNNARNSDPLSRAVGYIGKWEVSPNKGGLSFRIIFIFRTSDVGDIDAIQHNINFYWTDSITEGNGRCHHVPVANISTKFRKSYCHIKSTNQNERNIIRKHVIGYITKSEKYYCPKELRKMLNDMIHKDEKSIKNRELSLTFRAHSK